MTKGDPKKPKGRMTAYAFFVQTCREEHKKKNPEVPVNFAEFSKKCSERWKTISFKKKSKFDEMAKADKEFDYGRKQARQSSDGHHMMILPSSFHRVLVNPASLQCFSNCGTTKRKPFSKIKLLPHLVVVLPL
ncbi:hypothetical protein STEG23_012347 [Scotinomys teguina]